MAIAVDPQSLPVKRKWLGYTVVAATVLFTFALLLAVLWWAGELYDNPWLYPAKLGSHGTIILMCWAYILTTRFRFVERLFGGLDKVYKAHRHIGESALALILLHPLGLSLAYTDSLSGFFGYLWFSDSWVRNTGLIALLVFVLLVAVSIYVKIAYHIWKWTHHLFGPLLVLIVIHAVLADGEIVRHPLLLVWHGAWIAMAAAAYVYIRVLYRFIGPQYDYVIDEVRDAGDAITEIHLKPQGRPMRLGPGQFVYVSFDAVAVTPELHPFSLSSPPEAARIRLSIKQLGDWTRDAAQLKRGRHARVWGPYGQFGKPLFKQPHLPAVMIGGGIGITPFLSIAASAAFSSRIAPCTLIYSVTDQAAGIYGQELRDLAAKLPHLKVVEHFSNDEGYIDLKYLQRQLDKPLAEYLFLMCGPPAMVAALRPILIEAGATMKQVFVEDFDIR